MNIDRRIANAQAVTGKHIIVQSVRTPEPEFRAWVEVRSQSVRIDYVDELPGYFGGYALLEHLLSWIEEGGGSAWFYEYNGRLVRVPARRS